jgi:quinolinate synthase
LSQRGRVAASDPPPFLLVIRRYDVALTLQGHLTKLSWKGFASVTTSPHRQSPLVERILELKKRLNAVLMAHNYQRPEVQDVADFVGDSLELAREATELDAEVLVFCAVRFMAETAAILNPNRMVLLAEGTAGCPMADMIDVESLREWKAKYPEATVVCYVNSSAAVKAESDYCCTSANALKVVEAVPGNQVIFVPDRNLGHYVAGRTRKQVILYPGYCVVHDRIRERHVERAREEHPEAIVLIHPECRPEVIARSDAALSTSQMARYVKDSAASDFVIGTEEGLLHRLRLDNPDKRFYLLSPGMVCHDMKKTTLAEIVATMEGMENVVTVPEETRARAKRSLDRMLDLA